MFIRKKNTIRNETMITLLISKENGRFKKHQKYRLKKKELYFYALKDRKCDIRIRKSSKV